MFVEHSPSFILGEEKDRSSGQVLPKFGAQPLHGVSILWCCSSDYSVRLWLVDRLQVPDCIHRRKSKSVPEQAIDCFRIAGKRGDEVVNATIRNPPRG